MLIDQVAMKYAQAIYELAVEKAKLEEAEAQLGELEQALTTHADLATLIYHPRVEPKAKKEVLTRIFGGEVADFVQHFLLLLVDKRRETILPAIFIEFKKLVNEARNILEVEATTALPLSDDQHILLAQKLGAVTGKNVVLKTRIDPGILGGVIIKIGDKLIDGSVYRQLRTLEAAIMDAPVA